VVEITIDELKDMLDGGEPVHLLDIREAEEVAVCKLPGSEHIPMLELFMGQKKPEVGDGDVLVVYCHHGIRSFEAAKFLRMNGFPEARSLAGGIDAWAARIDPDVPRY